MAETSTAVIASANNLSVKYGTQIVLDGATIAFREGEHIGLVGRNGSANRPSFRSRRVWPKPIQANSHAGGISSPATCDNFPT